MNLHFCADFKRTVPILASSENLHVIYFDSRFLLLPAFLRVQQIDITDGFDDDGVLENGITTFLSLERIQ